MIDIAAVRQVLCLQVCSRGAPELASAVGATHLCLFLRDPELKKFLPAPGFPQTLPRGLAWAAFLRKVEEDGKAASVLPSPFTGQSSEISGKLMDPEVLLVLFGSGTYAAAPEELEPAISIISALFQRESEVRLTKLELSLVRSSAIEGHRLARSLSDVHERLAAALQRSHDLGQEVHRQQETLDLARQISGFGLWTFDVSKQVLRLSAQAASILGIGDRPIDTDLNTFLDRVHPDDRLTVKMAFQLDPHEKRHSLQFRLHWDVNNLRWIENRGVLILDDYDHYVLNGLSLDVTDRVRTEDALIMSEKLAAAGRLAATIAHEINNPLEGLINLIYIAARSNDLKSIHDLLSQAETEINRVSAVARQTLTFYRDLSTPVEFDLRTAIEQSLDVIGKEAHKKEVSTTSDLSPQAALVRGSVGELKQVFSNLFLNAVDACEPGATILIRVRSTQSQVAMLIADDGHGIPPELRGRIFEPFFSTRKEKGTGLGLWVTKQIIQKHGGTLTLRSSTRLTSHGTVFRVTLPSADNAPALDGTSLRYRWLGLTS